MFIRTQTNGDRTYVMLVENERVEGRLVQRVLHRFGRLDGLRASGQLDALMRSLGRFADKLVVLDAPASDQAGATPFGPRTRKDRIEEAVFARRRDDQPGDHRGDHRPGVVLHSGRADAELE